ncbi:MAG: CoA transferase [Rhizobiaceae bacterium]|nr:CoA transferase [Rhizobiaceae bacterium]
MLTGMKVLSFTHFVQGPAAAQYLADMGADVIKIEPLTGAFERGYSADNVFVGGVSSTFLSVNRNVRSIAVDLKSAEGKEVVRSLIGSADVILENYRIGVMDRLGFGYEDVKALNDKIIYASASGWGSRGPMATSPGQDLLAQARCGLMDVTGGDAAPTIVGTAIIDHHAAALLAMAVCAAYSYRLQHGEGRLIESNLFSAGMDLQIESIAAFVNCSKDTGKIKRNKNLGSWFLPAPYGVYKLADCHAVISNSGNVDRLVELIGASGHAFENIDRMADRDRFAELLADELQSWTFERLDKVLAPHGFWYQRVQNYAELIEDPQVKENDSLQEVSINGAAATLVAHPVRYDGKVPGLRHMSSRPGSDTSHTLSEAGWSEDSINDLSDRNIILK